ncbi:MAG: DUF2946 domain-containing protein [Xanthomonadaceae bacterium]|nr:DUF2946 domain-containing protein [Xanthomonadaceae bacterium]
MPGDCGPRVPESLKMRRTAGMPAVQFADGDRRQPVGLAATRPARQNAAMGDFRRTTRTGFVRGLALVAMWLTVVMPVVSRSMPDGMGSMNPGSLGSSLGLGQQHRSTSPDPSSILDKCGYCCLFCHSPMVAGDALPALPPLALSAQVLRAPTVPVGPLPQLLSASPRGPPLPG